MEEALLLVTVTQKRLSILTPIAPTSGRRGSYENHVNYGPLYMYREDKGVWRCLVLSYRKLHILHRLQASLRLVSR